MKNYFKLMSLLLGMVLCTTAFVACGDDDDDNNNGSSGGVVTEGKYAGNRLVGEWAWGDPNQAAYQEEAQRHQMGYIFNADGTCTHYMRQAWEGESWEENETGSFTLFSDIKLRITWTKRVYKENGKVHEEVMDEPETIDYEIMYPEQGNNGMFLKYYYEIDGRQAWTEDGPYYKK